MKPIIEPDFLYHYTSVEVLALILHHRKLRFRRLDLTDDQLESETADMGTIGRYVLASSWTRNPREHQLMWATYTGYSGVRIGLPVNPFDARYEITQESLNVPIKIEGGRIFSCIHPSQQFTAQYAILEMKPRLCPVEYTDDEKKLHPNVFNKTEGQSVFVDFGTVGTRKRRLWSYQDEWRYRFEIYPMGPEFYRSIRTDVSRATGQLVEAVRANVDPGIEWLDIPLREEALASMHICLGPKMTPANRIIVSTIVEKYLPSATVTESEFHGYMR